MKYEQIHDLLNKDKSLLKIFPPLGADSVKSGQIRNIESARVSMGGQVKK